MTNKLLVESKNDMLFFQALIDHLNLQDIEMDIPICQPDDYECMEGLNTSKLEESLRIFQKRLIKEPIEKIGIIIDHDNASKKDRLNLVNEAIRNTFETNDVLEETGRFITVSSQIDREKIDIKVGCCLTHVDGKGELETVLKTIKSKDAVYADCLESWRNCLKEKSKNVSDKEFDKFWVNNYIRFDTCSKKEQKQAARKCSMPAFEYIMKHKPEIWNFEHSALDELKRFLQLFSAET